MNSRARAAGRAGEPARHASNNIIGLRTLLISFFNGTIRDGRDRCDKKYLKLFALIWDRLTWLQRLPKICFWEIGLGDARKRLLLLFVNL